MTTDRLIYFGTDAFSVPPLIRLLAEGWNIVAVVTKPDSRTGRGQELTMPAVKRLAVAKGIPLLQPHKVADALPDIERLQPAAGIVVAYGKILPKIVLKAFPKGLVNIHPSLLPRYRGSSPIETVLLEGAADTGITIMQLDEGMDTGPTYEQTKFQLSPEHNRIDLYEELAELGADFLAAKLTAILDGNQVAIPQDHKHATVTRRLTKADGRIDWHKPAAQLEREIRAFLGWPGSHGTIAGTDVIVTKAHVLQQSGTAGRAWKTPSGELAIYCADGCLVIDSLKPAGKREMTGPEFLLGHKL